MQPTAEQRQIIEHTSGHALVFAVAGSGKTTTMVQRILHLIRQEEIRPIRILACTFSREAARTIEVRLARHPEATGVKVCTLHALASAVIREAARLGFTELRQGEEGFARRLFQQARTQLIEEEPERKTAFYTIKPDDFQTYLSVQKGKLHLPYVPDDLPELAQRLIGRPDNGVELYSDLYARHDHLRRAEGKVDFDDCIVEAWLLMARFPVLQEVMAGKWDYVHVDEFQDVNLAQSEMLNLLARGCHSYVAIGDDDQTIYQWRGADPRFILGFAERYKAETFTLSTNFRCPMGVIALADQVIQRNTVRAPKRLRASRGENGVFLHEHVPGQAAHVAINALEQGRSPTEIVILVRTYAQTGEIEQIFLDQEVPYLVVGGTPFYQRHEVKVLLSYLRLALADLDTQRGVPIDGQRRVQLIQDWKLVANTPNRYLRTQVVGDLGRSLWRQGQTLSATLEALAQQASGRSQRDVLVLSEALANLTDDLGLAQGKEALLSFASAIGYAEHLIETAPTREFGEEREGSVRALAEMGQTRSLGELVTYISYLSEHARHVERLSDAAGDEIKRITIMTAFRAKGLEWPLVIVPDCKEALYRIKDSPDVAAAEEERRVFYVALTRASGELHLVVDQNEPTRFLRDIHHERIVHSHTRLMQLMGRDPVSWSARETLEASTLLRTYGHEHYVQVWLDGGYRTRLLRRVEALQAALRQAQPYHGQAQTVKALSLEAYRQHGEVALAPDDDLKMFNDLDILIRELNVQHAPPPPTAPDPRRVAAPGENRSMGTALRPSDITVGMTVHHRRFGEATVLSKKGSGDGTEVELNFQGTNTLKRMLVVYANLQREAWQNEATPAPVTVQVAAPMGASSTALLSPEHAALLAVGMIEEELPF